MLSQVEMPSKKLRGKGQNWSAFDLLHYARPDSITGSTRALVGVEVQTSETGPINFE